MLDLENGRSRVIRQLDPSEENYRNSEGDFIRLGDGRIMFAYSRFEGEFGGDHGCCNIAALYSSDEGEHFDGEPRILSRAADFGEKNAMSVTMLRMKNGDLGLWHGVKTADGCTNKIIRRSADDGESFYRTDRYTPGNFRGYYTLNNCRIQRTQTGRLIMPTALFRTAISPEGKFLIDGFSTVYFFYSDDDGITWTESANRLTMPDDVYSKSGLQEPGVIDLPNGILYAYARSDRGWQYESFSFDDGVTWTKAQQSRFTSERSPMKIAKNPYTGMYYAVWNPFNSYTGRNIKYSWGRSPIVIAESSDGLNFSAPVTIEDDPLRGFCYPAIFFPDEHSMLISYCSGGENDRNTLCRTTIRKIDL